MPIAIRNGGTVRRAIRRATSRSSYSPEIFGGDLYSAANFNKPLGTETGTPGRNFGSLGSRFMDGGSNISFSSPTSGYSRDSIGTGYGNGLGSTAVSSANSGNGFSFDAGRNSSLGSTGASIGGLTGGPFGAVAGSFLGNALSGNPGTIGANTLGSAIGSLFGGYGSSIGSVAGNLYSGNYGGAAIGALGALARAAGLSNPAVAALSFAAPYLYDYFFGKQPSGPNGTLADAMGPGGFRGEGYDGSAGDIPRGDGSNGYGDGEGWTGRSGVESGGNNGGFYGQGESYQPGDVVPDWYSNIGNSEIGGMSGGGFDGPTGDYRAFPESTDTLSGQGQYGNFGSGGFGGGFGSSEIGGMSGGGFDGPTGDFGSGGFGSGGSIDYFNTNSV